MPRAALKPHQVALQTIRGHISSYINGSTSTVVKSSAKFGRKLFQSKSSTLNFIGNFPVKYY